MRLRLRSDTPNCHWLIYQPQAKMWWMISQKILLQVMSLTRFALQCAMQEEEIAVTHLADMMQNRWASYIRNSSVDDAKPYGTRAPQQQFRPRRFGSQP